MLRFVYFTKLLHGGDFQKPRYNKKSRTAPDATVTISHSAARLSFPVEETIQMKGNRNIETRGFPSPDLSEFGFV